MGENYHFMISDENNADDYENFLSAILQESEGCPKEELLDQIRMIHTKIRLDIGIKMNCRESKQLAGNAMVIASHCPFIQVHLLNLERFSQKQENQISSCLPFVLVNGRYSFFGNRSLEKLVWMIAEVIGKGNY